MTMHYTRFKEGEEPQVLTTVSEECDVGACEKCPGILHDEDYPGHSIFCTHECHRVKAQ
jgi:hypothetical protein